MHRNHAPTEHTSLAHRSQRIHLLPQLFLVIADNVVCDTLTHSYMQSSGLFLREQHWPPAANRQNQSVVASGKNDGQILVTSAGDVIS